MTGEEVMVAGEEHFIAGRHRKVDRAVGVQLQNLRLFTGMTLETSAERLGISHAMLERIESGDMRPSPPLALGMAKLYGVPPSRVFDVLVGVVLPDTAP